MCLILGHVYIKQMIQNGPQDQLNKIYDNVGPSVLKITKSGYFTGTGVIVAGKSKKRYVLTNNHICFGPLPLGIDILNINIPTKVVYMDRFFDLCLLEVPQSISSPDIKLSSKEAIMNEIIYIVGYPDNLPLGVYVGSVLDVNRSFVWTDLKPDSQCYELKQIKDTVRCLVLAENVATNITYFPGGSGSPALNVNGEIVGLVSTIGGVNRFAHFEFLSEIKRILETK